MVVRLPCGSLLDWQDSLATKRVADPARLFNELLWRTKSYTESKRILRNQYAIFVMIVTTPGREYHV